jgi:hypothetical protein
MVPTEWYGVAAQSPHSSVDAAFRRRDFGAGYQPREVCRKRHAFVATFIAAGLSLTFLVSGAAAQDKGTNFVLEGAATLNLGAKMMKAVPFLSGFGAYFLVDQQLSRVPRDANGDKDYWNPALVWGAFFQIAPWP